MLRQTTVPTRTVANGTGVYQGVSGTEQDPKGGDSALQTTTVYASAYLAGWFAAPFAAAPAPASEPAAQP